MLRSHRELLAEIHLRPSMWLGAESLSYLVQYLHGYAMACDIHKTPEAGRFSHGGIEKDLECWLVVEKGLGGAVGWSGRLLDECGSEPAALARFFELFDEFEATKQACEPRA